MSIVRRVTVSHVTFLALTEGTLQGSAFRLNSVGTETFCYPLHEQAERKPDWAAPVAFMARIVLASGTQTLDYLLHEQVRRKPDSAAPGAFIAYIVLASTCVLATH